MHKLFILIVFIFISFNITACEFGVHSHLFRIGHFDPEYTKLDWTVNKAKEIGVDCIRVGFAWKRIEKKQGKYFTKRIDKVYETLVRKDIKIIAVLHGLPRWVKKADVMPAWRSYMQWIKNKYPKIAHYQIWNEPNVYNFLPKEYSAKDYVNFVKIAREVLGSKAHIVSAGIANNKRRDDYIEKTLKLNLLNYADTFTIHPYKFGTVEILELINDLRSRKEIKGKELWITEYGWHIPKPYHKGKRKIRSTKITTDTKRTEYLVSVYFMRKMGLLDGISFYEFRDDRNKSGYGLFDIEDKLKPSSKGLISAVNIFSHCHFKKLEVKKSFAIADIVCNGDNIGQLILGEPNLNLLKYNLNDKSEFFPFGIKLDTLKFYRASKKKYEAK
ncbi:MAG: hypothetical protein KAH84_08590 [Thiomargarita sp.]|nr:hypothetical protein [Thiomargarita sp.]